MKEFQPTTHTVIFISLFVAIYLILLLKRAVKNKLDLYDFFMLSTLALVPAFFVVFPGVSTALSRLIGVEFPFLILFGSINFIAFLMLYRLIRRTNKLRSDLVSVVQELGLQGGTQQLAKRSTNLEKISANITK